MRWFLPPDEKLNGIGIPRHLYNTHFRSANSAAMAASLFPLNFETSETEWALHFVRQVAFAAVEQLMRSLPPIQLRDPACGGARALACLYTYRLLLLPIYAARNILNSIGDKLVNMTVLSVKKINHIQGWIKTFRYTKNMFIFNQNYSLFTHNRFSNIKINIIQQKKTISISNK